ncbi:hypothetical protein BDR26DRAFT_860141 [Obelidium mucronatum]|nr:hypothetical protein BDR26DRAFT_860141 [Obelidium mucronatum]
MAEYEEKQQNLREKQYIEADPNTNAFYKKVFSKMNEVFVATKAIKSGMVSRSQYSAGDKAAGMITLVGSLIPLPAAATVLGYVSKGVQYISDKREGERINNITSNALGFSEMDEICDWLSRGLVFAYEEQIRALTTEAADQFAECCVVYILDFLARTEDEKTAAAEAREASTTQSHPPRPLTREASSDTIGANNAPTSVASTPVPTTPDEVTATTPTEKVTISPREALVSDLLIYMSNRQGVKNGKYGFKDIELKTRIPGLVFTDRGIIKQSGLRTIHGTVYHAPPPPPPPPTSGDPLEQVERGIRRGVQKGLREPREKSRDPKSPNMQRTPSIGARLFRWGQAHSNPLDAVKTYGAAKEEAAATALDMSLKFKEVFGAVISGEEPCRPDIYGYRLGTQREATELGLFQVASRTVSRVVPLSAEQLSRDPTAQSKFWTGK